MNQERILIGCPINSAKSYCMDEYFKHLFNLSYPHKDFYFVDNSEDKTFAAKVMMKYGVDVDVIQSYGKRNNEILCECQNHIRTKALNGGYTHLLFVECDIMVTPNIIEKLLAYNEEVAVARYFIGTDTNNTHLIATEIEQCVLGERTNRNINWIEGYFEYGTRKTKLGMAGFGCILISRQALSLTPFFIDPRSRDHADSQFYFYLHDNGIRVAVDDEILTHKNSSWSTIKNY